MSISSVSKGERADLDRFLERELAEHAAAFQQLSTAFAPTFAATLKLLEASIRASGKVLLFGNGGSAADAQHLATEMVIRYEVERPAIAAIALTTDTSCLTAGGNDIGFDAIFARQIEAIGRAGDVAIAISTSGRSCNVLAGLRSARARGLRTIGMTGATGGSMHELCDVVISVPSTVTARIQEMHILIGHMLCKALETRLYPP